MTIEWHYVLHSLVDPAGTVLRFGDPDKENHSLDCIILPGAKELAVEDRYGVTIIDIGN